MQKAIVRGKNFRLQRALWLWIAAALWGLSPLPLQAQVRPAPHPLFSSRLQRLVDTLPETPVNLPASLARAQDVYLFVTAGASYTDIQVLANPAVPPQIIARALSSTLSRTSLHGQTVEWSADRFSAAQVSVRHSRLWATQSSNTVPIAPLVSGMRQAGLTPHLLLRIGNHARASAVPFPLYSTRAFRWYDSRSVRSLRQVTITARLTGISLARMAAFHLLPSVFSLLGVALAYLLGRYLNKEAATRRQIFRSVSSFAVITSCFIHVGGMIYLLRSSMLPAIADLWFGSSSTANLVPFLVAGVVFVPLVWLFSRKLEIRVFGPLPAPAAIPMSDEERRVRKHVAQLQMIPHLIGAVLLGGLPFFIPRSSPFYSMLHPVAVFLPIVGGGLIARIFQKRLDKFTQKTADDSLTWRSRQLGQILVVRMPDVVIEDSSRASHLAYASHQGHTITLSRKLQATFTPEETDFVLAHHLACMKPGSRKQSWLLSLLLLPMLLPVVLVLLPHLISGAPALTSFMLSSWFFPGLIGYFGFVLVLTFMFAGSSAKEQSRRLAAADKAALEATGNLYAAEGAIEKLLADTHSVSADTANRPNLSADSQAKLRRAELQKSARMLHFAPAPPAGPAEAARQENSFHGELSDAGPSSRTINP